jgi:hypothetical protein
MRGRRMGKKKKERDSLAHEELLGKDFSLAP